MGQSYEQRLEAAEQQLATRTTELEAANTRLAESTRALEAERARATQLDADLATARQSIVGLQTHVSELEKAAKTAEARAAEQCAAVGVTPLPVTPKGDRKAAGPVTARERWEKQFNR
jgi:chromosome segregation ATPase